MKQASRRLIAVLCALCMLIASMPVSAYAEPVAATPTDLAPLPVAEEQETPEEQGIPEDPETEDQAIPETQEEPEEPEAAETEKAAEAETEESGTIPAQEAPPEDGEPAEGPDGTISTDEPAEETDEPEITRPEADREVTGSDDITVTGNLEGNPPEEYLIRYTPEKNQTLCLILTADGELKATVTDESTGAAKPFVFDHTDEDGQSVLTLPYYKVKQDSTYLIRLSGDKPADFSIRMVKMSILKAEEENETDEGGLPDAESTPGTEEEPAADLTEEPAETPAEEPEDTFAEPVPEETPDESPAEDVTETSGEESADTAEEAPVEIRISATGAETEAFVVFLSDAGIPEDAELRVRELTPEEQARYQARTVRALECGDESYLYYTKYLEITLLHNGEPVELTSPVNLSLVLPDVSEGAGALQAVRFDTRSARLMDSEWDGRAISFRTDALAVFGIGNALTPLDTQETELASVEVLGFSADAEVTLKETEAPEVEEGLEVLGSFTVEDQTKTAGDEDTDGLWIKAELNGNADLAPMESVSLYRVEDGQAEMLVEDLSQNSDITELDAQQVAVIRDTGYRHLTLTVSPEDGSENQAVTLDGMMPKEAEAAVVDVTEQYTDYAYPEDAPQAEPAGGQADETESGDTRTTLAAYDISISHPDGEYQPDEDKPISVEILDERITAEGNIELWHIRDDGTREQVTDFTVEEGRIAFEATGFSVYAVIIHEGGEVAGPRVEFHFIADGAVQLSDGTNAYYKGSPYEFTNKHGDKQTSQILSQGEALELITDPGNQETKFFYGWYVVNPFPVSGTTDEYGIGKTDSKLYFTWPVTPSSVSFNDTLDFTESGISVGDTVHWSLGGISGAGKVDADGSVHVFLAPVFEKYNFINFMLYARDVGMSGASSLMTRKLIALGSSTSVEVKISDIRSTSKDPVHLLFIGWEYNAGTAENQDWRQFQTVDYFGAELKEEGKDGVYLDVDLADTQSLDLYPIFVQARWADFVSGVSGSGATYVPSTFRESWGTPGNPPAGMTDDPERNVFTSLPVPVREGYDFDGWYAFARMDSTTGDLTNLGSGNEKDITIKYLDTNYAVHPVTVNTAAVKITDGEGRITYNDTYTVDGNALFKGEDGTLRTYNALDRLTLYASWVPASSQITLVYWTENAEDDGYTSSAVRTITTAQLNRVLNPATPFASGSTVTLDDLKQYEDEEFHAGIVSRDILDDVGAVAKKEAGSQDVPEELFYDLKDTKKDDSDKNVSDASVVINGDGSTVFNVYFSRKIFKLVFHIGRDNYIKQGGNQKTTNGWIPYGNWIQFMFDDDPLTALLGHKGTGTSIPGLYSMKYNGRTYDSSYQTDIYNIMGDYVPGDSENDRNLYVIEAKYGAYIGDRWPTPTNDAFTFTNPANSKYTMFTWAGYYGSRYCYIANNRPGSDSSFKNPDLNGIYKYMSAELCANREGTGVINANQVHHIVAYFGEVSKKDKVKKYHTVYEAIPGTYDPTAVTLRDGTEYEDFKRTTWSENARVQPTVLDGRTFYEYPAVPDDVISNVKPQYQMAWELDGYTYFYSCYNTPVDNEHHVYFFYTPKQYTLTFMYENEADRKIDHYYYNQSLADANKYPAPEKEGYEFLGWYTNAAGAGKPFDFASETMPAEGIVLYPVMKALQYTVKIDPNGGVIDRVNNPSQSTYFTANYGTTVGEYNIERDYIRLSDKEQDPAKPTYYDPSVEGQDWYYYVNMQFRGESQEGDWGYPTELRDAIYVKASEIDNYYNNTYCKIIDQADTTWWTGIRKLSKDEFIAKYTSYPYRPIREGEHYSFMGWYQVTNGSVASMPYNFNNPVKGPVELRALWRLDGGYYIQYNPYFFTDDGHGNVTLIVGELEQWQDPTNPSNQLYADQSFTHILRAPTNTTSGWIFRGWRVVKANGESTYTHGSTTETYTNWEPIEFVRDNNGDYVLDENNEKIVKYYQPGDHFTIDSDLVTEIQQYGSVIHMQAYYEPINDSNRRPNVTNLILDANDTYVGGYLNTDDSDDLPALGKPGQSGINTTTELFNNHPTRIEIGDLQSNTAIHLFKYATDDTYDEVTGTNFFSNDGPYTLIGFDENEDPQTPTTGSAYVPKYAPDSVIAVTRKDNVTLYALWEPKIYVTFVNTTDEPIDILLKGNGTSTVHVINKVTGKYDREKASQNITIPAKSGDENGELMIVLPTASLDPDNADMFTAEAVNTHRGKQMSVSGSFNGTDYGTGSEKVTYSYTAQYEALLKLDRNGIVVTYTEIPDAQVDFNINGGTWQEQSTDFVLDSDGLYSIEAEKIEENQGKYEPAKPTREGMMFIGWTTDKNIADQTVFSATKAVTFGEGDDKTVIHPDEGCNILETITNPDHDYLWKFSQDPPYEETLYAVWTQAVTVTFDLYRGNNQPLHEWTGPATSTENIPYVFYRESPTSRYVTYTLLPGKTVPKPEDPTANGESTWRFYNWLTNTSYKNKAATAKDLKAIGSNKYVYDFTQKVTGNITLYTSWTEQVPQVFTFTVENRIQNGSEDDECTYTIAISNEKVDKSGTLYSPDVQWGSVSTKLKNNKTYTVRITVLPLQPEGWAECYSPTVDVIDSDGNNIKSGQLIRLERLAYRYYSSSYSYTLTISQSEKDDFKRVNVEGNDDNAVACSTDDETRSFTFVVEQGSHYDPNQNSFVQGASNSLTVIFNNEKEIIVAPTGLTSRHLPFFLMLAAGLVLMILLGGMRIYRKRAEEPDGEESPCINTAIPDTGPPGGGTSRAAPDRIGKRSNTDCEKDPVKGDQIR